MLCKCYLDIRRLSEWKTAMKYKIVLSQMITINTMFECAHRFLMYMNIIR